MNIRDAYFAGTSAAIEHGRHGQFTPSELANEDAFMQAIFETDENARQFVGHVSYDFAGEPNSEGLFDAYERGLAVGARRALRHLRKAGNPS